MQTVYEIVHVLPDKSERIVKTVTELDEVRLITEVTQFAGTWINDTRKILRYRRGELQIREQTNEETAAAEEITIVMEEVKDEPLTVEEAIQLHEEEAATEDSRSPDVGYHAVVEDAGRMICLVNIIHGREVHWIAMTTLEIIALDETRKRKLWGVHNFTSLGNMIDKHVAYECLQLYEKYFASLGAGSAI